MMRTYDLVRDSDVSGVSGTGKVGEVVEFSDGTTVVRWLTEYRSTAIYRNVEDAERIHGHGGETRFVPQDGEGGPPYYECAVCAERFATIPDFDEHRQTSGHDYAPTSPPAEPLVCGNCGGPRNAYFCPHCWPTSPSAEPTR